MHKTSAEIVTPRPTLVGVTLMCRHMNVTPGQHPVSIRNLGTRIQLSSKLQTVLLLLRFVQGVCSVHFGTGSTAERAKTGRLVSCKPSSDHEIWLLRLQLSYASAKLRCGSGRGHRSDFQGLHLQVCFIIRSIESWAPNQSSTSQMQYKLSLFGVL